MNRVIEQSGVNDRSRGGKCQSRFETRKGKSDQKERNEGERNRLEKDLPSARHGSMIPFDHATKPMPPTALSLTIRSISRRHWRRRSPHSRSCNSENASDPSS